MSYLNVGLGSWPDVALNLAAVGSGGFCWLLVETLVSYAIPYE